MMDDISKLVEETFHDNDLNGARDPFGYANQNTRANNSIIMPEEVPGILYNVQRNVSTFVIRILESENLAIDYPKVLDAPEDYPSLRLLNDSGLDVYDQLKYFECDTLSIAQTVRSHLSNKRFPIEEEHVFNVSDPGDCWWVKVEKNELTIYFKLSRTEEMGQLVKLGPLGDKDRALERFKKYYGHIAQIFPIEHYSSAHGQFCIAAKDENNFQFKEFTNLFTTGSVGHDFWMNLVRLELGAENPYSRRFIQEANYFLMELSVMRRFWRRIEHSIK